MYLFFIYLSLCMKVIWIMFLWRCCGLVFSCVAMGAGSGIRVSNNWSNDLVSLNCFIVFSWQAWNKATFGILQQGRCKECKVWSSLVAVVLSQQGCCTCTVLCVIKVALCFNRKLTSSCLKLITLAVYQLRRWSQSLDSEVIRQQHRILWISNATSGRDLWSVERT